jgi:hypothetical protein
MPVPNGAHAGAGAARVRAPRLGREERRAARLCGDHLGSRLKTLAWMIVGLIQSGKISLTAWTPYVHSRAVYAQSIVRRFARWPENDRIAVHALYGPLMQHALAEGGNGTLYLALDTSTLWNTYCVVRLSLAHRGRAVPLAGKRRCEVNRLPLIPGQALFWHHVHITQQRYRPVHMALVRRQDDKESRLVVSDELTEVKTFEEYGLHFDIEENCLADQSNGFQFESSLIRSAALERLCLGLAITTLYLVAQGTEVVHQGKRRWGDPHWFRGQSYLKIGWHWVTLALSRGYKLVTRVPLVGGADPEPAMASKSQYQKHLRCFSTLAGQDAAA